MKCYENLVYRGLIKDVSDEEALKKALDTEVVKFYIGYDPTGQSLTVGHLVQLIRSMNLQKYGHIPVVVIGGGTGLIGDPRQTSERKLLTLEESLENAQKIENQIKKYLPKAIFVNNYSWLKDISLITFLRDYGKNYSINYMLNKEVVKARLENGISYTEFSYMIIQAIDFLTLYEKYGVRMQSGGSDQWGNITSGLDLIRKTHPDSNALGFSSPLLLKSDGAKFGKSESGALWLDRNLTTPFELYQYFINSNDADCDTYLKFLTLLSKEEIEATMQEHLKEPEKRLAQKTIASEVVKLVHSKKDLESAIKISNALFGFKFEDLSKEEFKDLTKSFGSSKIEVNRNLLDLLVELELSSSKREAREFISSGAIFVGSTKITNQDYVIKENDYYHNNFIVIRRGKKKFVVGEK
ncbi:MAG: tyrosine--tRNA ligase [Acholeplasmatales bacterium]|jgi:tyrosyl-tRNA synthetase|nr:tyrosine--tRNA ligase [Acholeplasmatales bacterium]